MGKGFVLVIVLFLSLNQIATSNNGVASYYGEPYVPSSCFNFEDHGHLLGSVGDSLWDDGNACGSRYLVSCKGGIKGGMRNPCTLNSAVITVVDHCKSCHGAVMLLSKEAFGFIADQNAGSIEITYKKV